MTRPSVRPTSRLEAVTTALREQKLQDEPQVLEVLIASATRGQSQPEVWSLLHEAAARDDRVAELAFAYERLVQDRKFRFLPTSVQGELLMHAATFFADVFGDQAGAISFLEQLLAIAPSHPEAFAKIESLLITTQNGLKLADLYANAAMHREKGEQLSLLRRAAEIMDGFSDEQERAIRIYQQLHKLAPDDERVRRALETRYRQSGKFRDLARLLEQCLAAAPPAEEAGLLRERLVDLYAGELSEPERAIAHAEEILRANPGHEPARRAAHRILGHKALVARASAALADAYERLGSYPEAAALLAMHLEQVRGPKKAECQKRLAVLRQDKLNDGSGAFKLFEGVIAIDPSDDEARLRYRRLAAQLGRNQDAARLLSRAATGVRESPLKAQLLVEVGQIYLDAGDAKRARTALTGALETGEPQVALTAARALARIYSEASEPKALADMLEQLARLEPEEKDRLAAAERLAKLAESDLGDRARATSAWKGLLGTPMHIQALESLQALYEASGVQSELISVLDQRAAMTPDRAEAEALALRACELRSSRMSDRPAAIVGWTEYIRTYGPSHEANARLIPLLEQERKWESLVSALEQDVALASNAEKVTLLLKLANVRATHLHDTAGALDAYRQVWLVDPKEPTTRQALEKMLASGDGRLGAANLLEPCYRAERASAQLIRALETKAETSNDPQERLSALDEAAVLVEQELRDPKRALDIAGRALSIAVRSDRASVPRILERFERLAQVNGDAVTRSELLSQALGDSLIVDAPSCDLAKRTGEALVAAGALSAALAIFRRALEFEPSSADLLGHVDALLQGAGRPEERLVLYRAALEQPSTPERRRELLHAIGNLQSRELSDPRAAAETYRLVLAENPDDPVARSGLLDAYESCGDWAGLYEELRRRLDGAPDEKRSEITLKLGEVANRCGDSAAALLHYRALLESGDATNDVLLALEGLAEASGDAATLALTLERRAANTTDPDQLCACLERMGGVLGDRLSEHTRAAEAWKRAASIAEQQLSDEPRARALLERALAAAPGAREAAAELRRLCVRAEVWDRLPAVYETLVATAADDARAVEHLLDFEPYVLRSRGIEVWLRLATGLIERGVGMTELALCRARLLASDPERTDAAAAAFRALLEAGPLDSNPIVQAFESFLASAPPTAARREDRRFLFRWNADHAPDAQRVASLMSWGAAEEREFGDSAAAIGVYRKVLALEPERADAMEALVRLLSSTGDAEGALAALVSLRDHSEGSLRRERELQIADLLVSSMDQPEEALSYVALLLDANPSDPEALDVAFRVLAHPRCAARAASLLEKAACAVEDEEQARAILTRLLSTPRTTELQAARRRWFGTLLDKTGGDPNVALTMALRGVAEVPEDLDLWARVERLARQLGRANDVAEAYKQVLSQALDPALAAEMGRRAVDYHEEWFDDAQAVVGLLRRVLELSPEATWARDRLKLAYSSAERWSDLFALYDEAIERATDESGRIELLAEAGQTAKDFANDPDRAISYFERLLSCRPGDKWVSQLLERLYERQGRTEPLIQLLSSQLAGLSGESAQRLRARIATLLLRERRDLAAAFKMVEEMISLEPGRADAYALLEEMVFSPEPKSLPAPDGANGVGSSSVPPSVLPDDATQSVSPPPSVAASSGELTEAGPDLRSPSSMAGLPDVSGVELDGRAPGIIELAHAPSAVSVVLDGGSAAPVAAIPSLPPPRPARASRKQARLRDRAAAMLKERYARDNRLVDLARVLEVELTNLWNPKDRARGHKELLKLRLEGLSDDAGAFEHAAALVALEPRVPEHRKLLLELADRLGWHQRLVDVLVSTSDSCADPPLVVRMLAEAAAVCRDKLNAPERAIDLYAGALRLMPKDRSFALSIARSLDALLSVTTRYDERCWALERILALEEDAAACGPALAVLSDVALKELSDPDRAISAWRMHIQQHPDDQEAEEGLAQVLRRAERWLELTELLEQRSARGGESEAAKRDCVEAATLYARELKSPDRAIDTWSRIRRLWGPGADSFGSLVELLEAQRKWEDLAALIVDEATRALPSLPPEVASLRLAEIRRVAERAIRNTERATAHRICKTLWEAARAVPTTAFAEDPSAAAAKGWAEAAFWALDQLVRMALDAGEHATAVELLLDGASRTLDPVRSRQMRQKAAAIILSRLSDPPRGIAILEELLEQNEVDAVADAVVPEIATLYSELGAWEKLARLWERQAARHAAHGNPILGGDLWCKAAHLRENKLGDVALAISDCLEGASCGSQAALRELARLYTLRNEHAEAAKVLERVCEVSALETIAQDTIALANAHLAAGDRERARKRLEDAVATLQQPALVRARLRELYVEEQSWDRLAELLQVEAEDASDRADRLALLKEAAAIHLERRRAPANAVAPLEQALKLDPDDASIVLTLARALAELKRLDEAATCLRAGLSRYGGRKPKERALVHFELARVSLLIGERAEALSELAAAAKIDPAHPAILQALGKLAFEEGQLDRAGRTFRALLLVLGGVAGSSDVTVTRAEVLLELSAVAEAQQDAARAREFLDSALHAASENEREALALERVLRDKRKYDLLAVSLWSRLESSSSPDERGRLLEELASLYCKHVDSGEEVRARLRSEANRALAMLGESSDGSHAAWPRIEAVFALLGDTEQQASLLERRIQLAVDSGAKVSDPDPWYRLARLRFGDPATHDEGTKLISQALAIRVDVTRAEEVLRFALEQGNVTEQVVRLYEQMARQSGQEASVLDALTRLCELELATAAEVREAVELSRKCGHKEQAERMLERAVSSAVRFDGEGRAWMQGALADLCESRGELARAADLREAAAAHTAPAARRALLFSVAEAARGPLGDIPRAARILASLRDLDPGDRTLWQPLLELYRKLGDRERLVRLISEALPLVESRSERSILRLEQIQIMLEDTAQTELAIVGLRELLDDEPGHVQAAFMLSELLEKSGRLDDLSDLLQQQLDLAKDRSDPASVVSLSMRLGELYERQSRLVQSLDVYRSVLDWDPNSLAASRAIVRITESVGDSYELAYSIEGLLRVETGEPGAALALRLLALRREQEDREGADRAIQLGFRAHPASAELRAELLARCREPGSAAGLAAVLEEGFARNPDDRELLGALLDSCRQTGSYEPALAAVTHALEKAPHDTELYRQRASVLEALGRFEEAGRDLERVYAEGGAEHAADLIEGLARLAERIGAPSDREIKLRLVDMLSSVGQTEAGRAHLSELLRRDAKDRDALRALARIEEREEHWDVVSTIFRRLLPLEEGQALVDVAGKLALACERAGRPADARSGLERALKAAPGHAELRSKLEDVYEKTGAHRELAEFVLEDARKQGDVAGRFALLLRAGQLLASPEGDPARAVSVLEEARGLRPEDEDAIVLLGRAYGAAGRTSEAVRLFQDAFSARAGTRTAKVAAMYRELARIRHREGDRTAALDLLTHAFEIDLHNGEVALELGLLAREAGNEELAARALRSVTFMKPAASGSTDGASPAAKGLAYCCLAQMARDRGDVRKARLLAQKALTEDPALESAKQLLAELKAG